MSETGKLLKKIHNRLTNHRNYVLKEYDLTGVQMETLMYLAEHEEKACTVSCIAQWAEVKHTSVLHVLKLLEAKGLIRREVERNKTHSRSIQLTDKARVLYEKNMEKIDQVDACMLAGFSEKEKQELRDYLQRIYINLEKLTNEEDN